MRVLLLSTYTTGGGAAVATERLRIALEAIGVEVRLLTLYYPKTSLGNTPRDEGVLGCVSKTYATMLKAVERADIVWHNGCRLTPMWRFSSARVGLDISQHPWVEWADIIHLHWVNQGFLSLRSIERLRHLGKGLVWTLHDLWAATGGCHIPLHFEPLGAKVCTAWANGCKACPLFATPRLGNYAHRLHEAKRSLHNDQGSPIHFVAVSRRTAKLFDQSSLRLGAKPCRVIAPPISLAPMSKANESFRPEWYRTDTYYLLLAAARLDDAVKGGYLLAEVLQHLGQERARAGLGHRIELLLVGEGAERLPLTATPEVSLRPLGRLTGEALAGLYRDVVDITLSTSLFETFGQTLTESLSYGKPVVAFRAYGAEDIIIEGQNGYLADAYDTRELAGLVIRLLRERTEGLCSAEACRSSLRAFEAEAVAGAYQELYHEIVVTLGDALPLP